MADLRNVARPRLEDLRSVEWGNSLLWDIIIPDLSGTNWIPAYEVVEERGTIISHSFDIAGTQVQVPIGSNVRTIKVSFYDTADHKIFSFLDDWYNLVLNDGKFVAVLDSATKQLKVSRKEIRGRQVIDSSTQTYWVYPDGPLEYRGDSDPKVPVYDVTFVVAGTLTESKRR